MSHPNNKQDGASASPDQEALWESLLIAYDEALARGDDPALDEGLVPPELQPRLRALLACVSLLARTRPPAGLPAAAAPVAREPQETPLKAQIGRFELLRELGRGGHGIVFLAVDPRLRRLVALKVPRPEVLITPELHRRFLREGQAASALAHPNLVTVYEVGEDGPVCYIAAAYCEGPTLATWLKQLGSLLPFDEAAALLALLADAAAHAHARGIVHRDIKPANVLLAPADSGSTGATALAGQWLVPCLTDFGLARLTDDDSRQTRTGVLLGTPSYMAPEQAAGRAVDVGPATDVYGLGAVLYELLVGRPPFRGANDLETLRLVGAAELVTPSALRRQLPRDLEAICLKALAPSPADRYAAAAALAADLRRFVRGEPTEARRLGRLRRGMRWVRRRPVHSALLAATLVLLALVAGGGRWHSQRLAETLETSRQAARRRDELRYNAIVRSAWQAYDNDNAAEAQAILAAAPDELAEADRGFAWRLLSELVKSVEPITFTGHTGDVYYVAFSPDGRLLATASQDHTVRLWNASTGKLRATLKGHTDEVNAVAWSPDGKLVASASDDGTVRLWNPLTAHAIGPVLRVGQAFQPDARQSEEAALVERFEHGIVSLAFSPDGAYLVSGDGRGRVVFTETADWQTAKTMETEGGRIEGLALNRDGTMLATASHKRGVQLWDLATGAAPRTSPPIDRAARGVAFGPEDRLLCCGYTWAYLWDWRVGRKPELLANAPDYINSVAFCGGGSLVALGGQDDGARVFHPYRPELRQTLLGPADRVWCVAASPDGWRLAAASADDTVQLWPLSRASAVLAREVPVPLKNVAFLADGQTLVAARDDGAFQRWRIEPDSPAAAPAWQIGDSAVLGRSSAAAQGPPAGDGVDTRIRDLAVSPDGRLAAACHHDSVAVELVEVATGKAVGELFASANPPGQPAQAVCFSPDGQTLAEAVGSSIRLWNVKSRRIERQIQAKDRSQFVGSLDFSADGRRLAAGAGERLQLWDVAGGKLLAEWRAHRSQILVVAFSPSGLLASAGHDHLVRLWNGATGEAVATFSGHFLAVEALSFSPDGRLLASGGSNDAVKLWSLVTYEEVATLHGLRGSIRGLSFSPTRLVLAATGVTADHHGHLRLWCAASPDATWQPLIAPQLEKPAAR